VTLPLQALALLLVLVYGLDADTFAEGIFQPSLGNPAFLVGTAQVLVQVPLMLVLEALAARALGRVTAGVLSRWTLAYLRLRLKAGLVESANQWLNGALLRPCWLRCAGMKIGRGCEISTIIDTIPELVEIGPGSFLADGIYLGGPRIHWRTVTVAAVRLGAGTYFCNNVLIAGGQTIPDNVLLGVSTVADDRPMRPGTSWFGQPPFELPRREVVECDQRYTYARSRLRLAHRIAWELLRFSLPLMPFLMVLAWCNLLAAPRRSSRYPCCCWAWCRPSTSAASPCRAWWGLR
jgi:hypothetical protein